MQGVRNNRGLSMPMRNLFRSSNVLCAWLFSALAVVCASSAYAAPIPWRQQPVSIAARELPLKDFLRDLFAGQGISVFVSESVTGNVNGKFQGPAQNVFESLVKSFALIAYFDGSMVYVYASGEGTSRAIPVSSTHMPSVVRALDAVKMFDSRNTIQALVSEGLLVASGTRRFVDQVEQVARTVQGQASAAPAAFRVFQLKYAWAADATVNYAGRQVNLPGVATMLRSLLGSPARDGAYLAPPARDPANPYQEGNTRMLRPTAARLGGTGMTLLGEAQTPPPLAPQPGAPPGAAPQPSGAPRDVGMQTLAPDEFFSVVADSRVPLNSPNVRIESDRRLNAVIVRDSKERMVYYEELIKALDVEPQLIEIEATIIDINSDRLRELGINWRFNGKHADVLFGRGDASDRALARDTPSGQITPQGAGLFLSTIIGSADQFISRINALADDNAAHVVARPQVITMSNVEAVLENNRTFYVRVPGAYQVDLFNVVAGTTLRVTPHLVEEGGQMRIQLLVNVEDGDFATDPNSRVDQIPVVNKSSINTQAMVINGESLLLGGMARSETSKNTTKVPVLGDIPGLGLLFRSTRDQTTKTERMFLISPRLVSAQRGNVPPQYLPDIPRTPDGGGTQEEPSASQSLNSPPRTVAAPPLRPLPSNPSGIVIRPEVSGPSPALAPRPLPSNPSEIVVRPGVLGQPASKAALPQSPDADASRASASTPPLVQETSPAPLLVPERVNRNRVYGPLPRSVFDIEG
jgi:type III secretion protein C